MIEVEMHKQKKREILQEFRSKAYPRHGANTFISW